MYQLLFQKRHLLLYGSPGTGKTVLLMQALRKRLAKYNQEYMQRKKKENTQRKKKNSKENIQEDKPLKAFIIIYHALVRTDSQIFTDMEKRYIPSLMLKEDDITLMHFREACRGT